MCVCVCVQVYLKAPMILNGVCVIWKGWIDLQRLDGMGCLEFDEERAQVQTTDKPPCAVKLFCALHASEMTDHWLPVFLCFIQQEDALAQAAFEEARRRTRDFEDRDRSHREDMEVRAGVSEDGCVKFRSVSACWKSNMFLCLKEFTSECVYVCILCVCICVHVFSTCACTILLYVLFMHNLYLIPLANILIDSHCQNIWCFKEQFTENAIFY